MKILRLAVLAVLAFSALVVLCAGQAAAQDYPNRPIHVIVAYSAGAKPE